MADIFDTLMGKPEEDIFDQLSAPQTAPPTQQGGPFGGIMPTAGIGDPRPAGIPRTSPPEFPSTQDRQAGMFTGMTHLPPGTLADESMFAGIPKMDPMEKVRSGIPVPAEDPWLKVVPKAIMAGLGKGIAGGTAGTIAAMSGQNELGVGSEFEQQRRSAGPFGMAAQMTADIFGAERSVKDTATNKFIQDYAELVDSYWTPKVGNNAAKGYVSSVLQSTATSVPLMMLGPAALPMFGVTSGGNKYLQMKKAGQSELASVAGGAIVGFSEAVTEVFTLKELRKAGTPIVTRMLKSIGWELPGEEVNTLVESLVDKATINPDMVIGGKDWWLQFVNTAAVTLGQSAMIAGVAHAVYKGNPQKVQEEGEKAFREVLPDVAEKIPEIDPGRAAGLKMEQGLEQLRAQQAPGIPIRAPERPATALSGVTPTQAVEGGVKTDPTVILTGKEAKVSGEKVVYHRGSDPRTATDIVLASDDAEAIAHYGDTEYAIPTKALIPMPKWVQSFADEYYKKLHGEDIDKYPTAKADPEQIIDSADVWDDPDFIEALSEKYEDKILDLQEKGIYGFKTNDGAVIFPSPDVPIISPPTDITEGSRRLAPPTPVATDTDVATTPLAQEALKTVPLATAKATSTVPYRIGGDDAFKIETTDGSSVMGQVRNGNFPGEEMNPKTGEIFLIESTVKQKGVGTSLIKDALNLMVENGSDSVVMTIPKTADGKAFVQSLIKKGLISDAIKTAESGTTLHNIQQAHTEQGNIKLANKLTSSKGTTTDTRGTDLPYTVQTTYDSKGRISERTYGDTVGLGYKAGTLDGLKEMVGSHGEQGVQQGKEPWEMTKKEYSKAYKNGTFEHPEAYHFNGIVNAISAGKPVPPEVLADYPELQQGIPQQGAAEKPTKGIPRKPKATGISKKAVKPKTPADDDIARIVKILNGANDRVQAYTPSKPTVTKFAGSTDNLRRTDEGSYTNGAWLLREEYVNSNIKKRFDKYGQGKGRALPESQIAPDKKGYTQLTLIGEVPGKDFAGAVLLSNKNGDIFAADKNYYSYLNNNIKNISIEGNAPDAPYIIRSGKKLVGYLMPRRELGDIEDDMQGMIKELMNRPSAKPSIKPIEQKPTGIPRNNVVPEQWQEEVQQVQTALKKIAPSVKLDITFDHKSITKDPTDPVDRAWLLERGDITPEEIQNAIENGDTFETQGAYIVLDSTKGQERTRIEILPDADAGVIRHEFGHLIEEAGLIPGWAGKKEQHADYLAKLLGEDKLKGVIQDDGLRGPPGEYYSIRRVQKEASPIDNVNKKKAPLKLFHSVKLPDLDMISGVENKIISPSFGIARDEKVPLRYGDITFIVPTKFLKKTPIWNRDIWSPTIKEAPDELYFIDRNSKEARLLKKYGPDSYRYMENSLTHRDNAPEQFASIELGSDGDLYLNTEAIAEELGIPFDYEDEDMPFRVLETLANGIFKKQPRTPENIALWLKNNMRETGSGSMFKGGQSSARQIPYDQLSSEAQKTLLDSEDEDLSKTLFSKQYDAREKVADLLKLKQDGFYSLRPRMDDEMSGEWAVMPFEEFVQEMKEWKLRESEMDTFDEALLKKAHKILQKVYRDIPAEYFEAKSYDVFNINQFPNVVSGNPDGIKKLREMGYKGEVHPSFTDYIDKADKGELLYSVRRVPAKRGEVAVTPPTEKEVIDQYEKIKDIWIGEKDVRILQAQNEMRMNQMMIKEALGIKKYTHQAKDYDRAIQIYLDLKRNPDHLEKYYDDLTKEQQRIVDLSQNLPPKIQEVANRIDQSYKELALQAQNVEIINNVLENYVARVWKMTPEGIPGAMRKFSNTTGHAKQRKIETILQGQALGYDLQIEGATNSLLQYREELVKVVEDKIFLEMLKKMKTSEGLPVVTTDPPHGLDYVRLEHPNLNTWKWVGKVEPGKTFGRNTMMTKTGDILERRELYAPKKIAKNLNNILGVSKLKGKPGIHEITKYNAILKSWILQSSLFHHTAFMRSYYLGTNGKKFFEMSPRGAYREGLEAIHREDPVVMLGVRNGLTLGLRQDWNEKLVREGTALGKLIDKVPGAGPLKNKIQGLRQLQADFLFESLGAGLKAKAFMLEYNNQVKKHPNQDPSIIANRVANLINDDFGGLHLQRMGRDPTLQHIFRVFCLAPDWTESNIRSMVKMFNKDKDTRATYQRFWANIVTKGLIATAIANVIMATLDEDDDPETNAVKKYLRNLETAWKQGKLRYLDVDVTPIYRGLGGKSKERKYFSIVGHFKDPIKFILNPFRSAKHKTSVIGGMVLDAASGTDWAGRRFTDAGDLIADGEAVKWSHKGSGPVKWQQIPSFFMAQSRGSMPVQFQNLMSWYFGEMEAFDAIANGAGLGVATTYNLGESK